MKNREFKNLFSIQLEVLQSIAATKWYSRKGKIGRECWNPHTAQYLITLVSKEVSGKSFEDIVGFILATIA